MSAVLALPRGLLLDLASALETGALTWPPSGAGLARLGMTLHGEDVAAELLALGGALPAAYLLRLLAQEREQAQRAIDRLQLVWTGPETPGSRSRDTAVVVRELFASAERSVLVSTYAIHQGRQTFLPLAERMAARPGLSVRLFLNVQRPHSDQTPESELLKRFADGFRSDVWPGERLPEVYYDRRALASGAGEKACLHAKCVIVDDRRAFVTSANFTEAAQERNIEAGVLVEDESLAAALRAQFESLVGAGLLLRLPLS